MNYARLLVAHGQRRSYVEAVGNALTLSQGPRGFGFSGRSLKQPPVTMDKSTIKTKIQQMAGMGVAADPEHLSTLATAAAAKKLLGNRPLRKKQNVKRLEKLFAQGALNVRAFSTSPEYELEALLDALNTSGKYNVRKLFSTDNLGLEQNVLYASVRNPNATESRDVFFFREGSVILWNFSEVEANDLLFFLRQFEKDAYLRSMVSSESEVMPYTYIPQNALDIEGDIVADADVQATRAFFHNGKFFLVEGEEGFLQKYTFSNAMATSIKLGIWEATLDQYIDSIEALTDDLKMGRRLRITRAEVLRKTGELFALRHVINLSSELLDTPDFYWDREQLEPLYLQVCAYFGTSRRVKVMNEKLNQCVALTELVSHNVNDVHHVRLEWVVIILLMIDVGFVIINNWH